MKQSAIMGPGPTGEPIGAFDDARVQRLLDLGRQTAAARGITLPPGLTSQQLFTNTYIDSSVRGG